MSRRFIRGLFGLAAVYDGALGVAFLAVPEWLYQALEVTPPNHFGYVHFSAALLLVFAIMFVAIARAPEENRGLIPYGMLLKASYCSVVFFHWAAQGLPWIWKPFAIADLAFLVLFLWAFRALRPTAEAD